MFSRNALLSLFLVSIAACGAADSSEPPAPLDFDAHLAALAAKSEHTDERVEVQHVLISFAGRGTKATRSQAEAETLARQVYDRVQAGEDFDALVKEFTDDSHPGIYLMTQSGPTRLGEIYNRKDMVGAFGNVGWKLAVGEVGVAAFDPDSSPYGWHIVKRLN